MIGLVRESDRYTYQWFIQFEKNKSMCEFPKFFRIPLTPRRPEPVQTIFADGKNKADAEFELLLKLKKSGAITYYRSLNGVKVSLTIFASDISKIAEEK